MLKSGFLYSLVCAEHTGWILPNLPGLRFDLSGLGFDLSGLRFDLSGLRPGSLSFFGHS